MIENSEEIKSSEGKYKHYNSFISHCDKIEEIFFKELKNFLDLKLDDIDKENQDFMNEGYFKFDGGLDAY